MAVGGKPVSRLALYPKVEVQFGPNHPLQIENIRSGQLGTFAPALIADTMMVDVLAKPATPAGWRSAIVASQDTASAVILGRKKKQAVVLETGPMAQPFANLDVCIDALVRSWGVDPEVYGKLSRYPTPANSTGEWLTPRDYPRDMLEAWTEDIFRFVLLIDATGKVTACRGQEWMGTQESEDLLCATLKSNARFEPALDADGKPVPSYYRNSVLFDHPWR